VDFSIKKANGAVFMPFAIRFLDVLFTILFIKADNAVLLKIPQIVAMTGFLQIFRTGKPLPLGLG